jgi:acetyl esterase/lipase
VVLVVSAGLAAVQLSPWPGALVIRYLFDREAESKVAGMERHMPAGITARLNETYDPADPDARFDLFLPAGVAGTEKALPAVVWVHGGAWISGTKAHVAPYLRILAGNGYAAIGVGYSLAPGANYPGPIRQVNAALAHISKNAASLNVDPTRIFIAGDSAGAQITGQLANLITAPTYARAMGITPAIDPSALRGVILNCGAYDAELVNYDGAFGFFLKTVLWSYFGRRDFLADPRLRQMSVIRNVTGAFPAMFITAGNGDPLEPQSRALAAAAAKAGVAVESLFFPKEHVPALPHEHQFNLDTDAARQVLARTLAFLAERTR